MYGSSLAPDTSVFTPVVRRTVAANKLEEPLDAECRVYREGFLLHVGSQLSRDRSPDCRATLKAAIGLTEVRRQSGEQFPLRRLHAAFATAGSRVNGYVQPGDRYNAVEIQRDWRGTMPSDYLQG